jgi:hypothetical protein
MSANVNFFQHSGIEQKLTVVEKGKSLHLSSAYCDPVAQHEKSSFGRVLLWSR